MQKRYLVIGGEVISANDRQRHYISPRDLCRLYMVDPQECVLLTEDTAKAVSSLQGVDLPELVVLRPLASGQYQQERERLAAGRLCAAVLERSLPETVQALRTMRVK